MYYFSCTYSTDAQLHGTPLTQPLKLPLLTIGVLLSSGNLPNYYKFQTRRELIEQIWQQAGFFDLTHLGDSFEIQALLSAKKIISSLVARHSRVFFSLKLVKTHYRSYWVFLSFSFAENFLFQRYRINRGGGGARIERQRIATSLPLFRIATFQQKLFISHWRYRPPEFICKKIFSLRLIFC